MVLLNAATNLSLFDQERDAAIFPTLDEMTIEERKAIESANATSKNLNNGDGGYGGRKSHGYKSFFQVNSVTDWLASFGIPYQHVSSSSEGASNESSGKISLKEWNSLPLRLYGYSTLKCTNYSYIS